MTSTPPPYAPAISAVIHDSGFVQLDEYGDYSEQQLPTVDDAQQFVGARAVESARRSGQNVLLECTDPSGSWLFLASPGGTLDNITAAPGEELEGEDLPPAPDQDEPAFLIEPGLPDSDLPESDLPESDPPESGLPESDLPGPASPAVAAPPPPLPPYPSVGPSPAVPPAAVPPAAVPPAAGPPSFAPPPFAPGPAPAPVAVARAAVPPAMAAPVATPPRPQHFLEDEPEPKPRRALPTLDDLLESRPTPPPGPATTGWQGAVRRASFGLVNPRPSDHELAHRAAVATIQRSLAGPRTVVVVNPKGGATKTTATMLLAATFATHRGGYTLAWDNNETRGTLGWRALPSRHTNTAVDLLADLERFQEVRRARVGDLDNYVRSQGEAQFDVLASDEDASASASIDDDAFNRLHATLSRFYRVLVIDTGNNMRASNWEAAIQAADQLVIVSTLREDTAASAAWLIDGLRSKGHEEKVAKAVTILTAPSRETDPALVGRLHDHFGQLTRTVIDVPHDATLVAGGTIEIARLSPATREAWVHATAAVADGL